MGEIASPETGQAEQQRETNPWPTWSLLLALMILAGGVRAGSIWRTEVAARDSIGFIRYALDLERLPVQEAVNRNLQHPGYPLSILAVVQPMRFFFGTDSYALQLSAQLASAIASILLIFPMFYLGCLLFDRRIGFWAAAIFQCLPASSRVLSDGLSDALFLLLATTALLLAVVALRRRSAFWFGLCGAVCGLAYLTRPEGVLVLAAVGSVLVGAQLVLNWRRAWGATFTCCLSLVFAAVVVGSPYVAMIGAFSLKTTALAVTQSAEVKQPVRPVGGPVMAVWAADYTLDGRFFRPRWGLWALGYELQRGFYFCGWVLALLGLAWFHGWLRREPALWLLPALALLHGFVLWRVASVAGYVSERHTLVIVLCGVYWMVAGIMALAAILSACSFGWLGGDRKPLAEFVLLLAAMLSGLPVALKPLHANRAGHHAAGSWLAEHTDPADFIMDPFCWASFYAGRAFPDKKEEPIRTGYHPSHYIILDGTDNHHSRTPQLPEAIAFVQKYHGRVVYHWPEQRPVEQAEILVYAVP